MTITKIPTPDLLHWAVEAGAQNLITTGMAAWRGDGMDLPVVYSLSRDLGQAGCTLIVNRGEGYSYLAPVDSTTDLPTLMVQASHRVNGVARFQIVVRREFGISTPHVLVDAHCPLCGAERGLPSRQDFVEHATRHFADTWTNPCGHRDNYMSVAGEAEKYAEEPWMQRAVTAAAVRSVQPSREWTDRVIATTDHLSKLIYATLEDRLVFMRDLAWIWVSAAIALTKEGHPVAGMLVSGSASFERWRWNTTIEQMIDRVQSTVAELVGEPGALLPANALTETMLAVEDLAEQIRFLDEAVPTLYTNVRKLIEV